MTEHSDLNEHIWARKEILEEIPGYDPEVEIIYHGSWSDYEEAGWTFILRKNGQLYELTWQSSVYGYDDPAWDLVPVTPDQAYEHMTHYESTTNDEWSI